MPIYEYECCSCGLRFEYLVRSNKDSIICPACNRRHLKRLISNFSFGSKDASGNIASSSSDCSGCTSQNCSACSG